jgi:hypothetical protein
MPRPKGSLNKRTGLVKQIVESAIGMSIPEKLIELANDLPKKEQSAIYQTLLQYSYPKLQSTVIEADITTEVNTDQVAELVDWLKRIDRLE